MVNWANFLARGAMKKMTRSPHQPPAPCQSAANPLWKAFSAPANSEPEPIRRGEEGEDQHVPGQGASGDQVVGLGPRLPDLAHAHREQRENDEPEDQRVDIHGAAQPSASTGV